MILLLSSSGDYSTDLVIDWLDAFNHEYIRINAEDLIDKKIKIELSSNGKFHWKIAHTQIPSDEIHAAWFRKFYFVRESLWHKNFPHNDLGHAEHSKMVKQIKKLLEFIALSHSDISWLTNPNHIRLNKPFVLMLASKIGLNIPDTTITNYCEDNLAKKNLITKTLTDSTIHLTKKENRRYFNYTAPIPENVKCLKFDNFLCSMIQKKIEKDYDMRVFYLCGEMWGMAIYSQSDTTTKIDFRKYNWQKPNRYVPINIPDHLKDKIRTLMKILKLNTGSIDFVKSLDGFYYFLEINPTGQFGMMEAPCNYPLHRKIAEKLIELDNNFINHKIL